jgi:predicted RNA-binding protein with TRAM domain
MGCQHYGDRGGKEWCNHYNQPIEDLKSQPVKPGEEVVIEVEDIHESGAGVGRTEDGFIIMVDGLLPPARARVKVTNVMSNHARGEELERLPEEGEESDTEADQEPTESEDDETEETEETEETPQYEEDDPRLGSRDNFWGG